MSLHLVLRIIPILFLTLFLMGNVHGQSAAGQSAEQNSSTQGLADSILGQANECPEGQFLDLNGGQCRNLVKDFGFRPFQAKPSARQVTLERCKYSALVTLLDLVEDDGGTIVLPACTIDIDRSITIPDNVVLQGAGIGQTILRADRGFEGGMLRINHAENIIVRDLTLDGNRTYATNIQVYAAHNVLLERVETRNTTRTGISFRYTRNITIRYSASHDHASNHGIGSKDCFPDGDKAELRECEIEAGNVSPGTLWSQNYAIYSNRLYKNADYGLDSHASDGEIAGNVIIGNERGTKFPDASQLWIHHNLIADNRDWGTRVYSTLRIPERQPQNFVYFQNTFQANGGYPVSLSNPTHDLFLIENQYIDNDPQRLSIVESQAYACAGTQDEQIAVRGIELGLASAAKCDLANIAQIFGSAPGEPIEPTPTPDPAPEPTPEPSGHTYLPGRLQAEDYREGGEGIGYSDSTVGNAGGAYRNDHVDIEASADGGSAHEIGWIDAGEWLAYDVIVAQSGVYRFDARVATWGADQRALRVEVDGQNVTGSLRFDASRGNRAWVNASAGGIYLDAGAHQVRVVMETGKFNFDYIDVTAERYTAVSRIVIPFVRR